METTTTTTTAQAIVYTPRGFVFSIEDTGLLTATTLPITLSRPAGEKTPAFSEQYATVEQAKSWAASFADLWASIYGEPIPTAPVLDEEFGDPFAAEPTVQAIVAKHPDLFAAAQLADVCETPEFCAFMEREMNAARERYFALTDQKREQIAAWNR